MMMIIMVQRTELPKVWLKASKCWSSEKTPNKDFYLVRLAKLALVDI